MSRRVITAEMVQQAASVGRLEVPAGAVITPLARDAARDLKVSLLPAVEPPRGVESRRPDAGGATDELGDRIRTIVTALLAGGGSLSTGSATPARRPVVKLCRQADARTEPFAHAGPPDGMQVRTGDVVTAEDGSPVAAGYMEMTAGEFPWTFGYDEVQIVLEGELHLGTPEGVRIGRPGDILYVPKGSEITFGTPTWTKFVYVTFPADWEAGL